MSALALKLIQEAKEQRLTRLDLGNCGLTELPDELFELTWLEELDLGNKDYMPYGIKEDEDVTENYIKYFKPKIEKLAKLKKLIARGVGLGSDWTFDGLMSLKSLQQLEELDIKIFRILTP
jgi:internalin A